MLFTSNEENLLALMENTHTT